MPFCKNRTSAHQEEVQTLGYELDVRTHNIVSAQLRTSSYFP